MSAGAVLAQGLGFFALRLGRVLLVVLAVLVGTFLLLRLAPGDPALSMASAAGLDDPAYVEQLRRDMGLDRPLGVQLVDYLGGLAQGDLGYSQRNQAPVWPLIAERLPATLLLLLAALLLSSVAGIALGVLAAWSRQHGGWLDRLISLGVLLLFATPTFWLALLLVMLFSVALGWLPAFGMETVGAGLSGWPYLLDVGRHLLLPALSLSFVFLAVYVQLARAAMLEAFSQEFVRSARAKGASEARVLLRHVLRNALLPVTTYVGLQLGQLASASLLVEVVYAWPGIGRLLYESLEARDYPLLLGVFLVISLLVLLGNLLGELLCYLLDPRLAVVGERA
ncbi:ABC transporter permease [Stutzerimonas kirkiae]|uniref:ABC transporter permease n=1 Tax=Stutzerimonas kirkiae TaxID=2211392 RepID=UPI001038583F|nr:ABC transporter permease [Stutzerimonas kirkiae]TBV10503.1 ABC transporter permease [Stutzerimonas kirkiae]TBV13941.1 ABC transporter permease [Stutzerimonas kirkiae]